MLNDENNVLFVRKFSPAKYELGKFDEIVLGGKLELLGYFNLRKLTIDWILGKLEIKTVLSELSGIPAENIMYAKVSIFILP